MSEYFLQIEKWPTTIPNPQRELLQGIVKKISMRSDLMGLAIGGSFVSDEMDDYSDLDLKVVVDERKWQAVNGARRQIAASVGPLINAFTAEHIGIPQMLICLYGEIPIHVDLNFMVIEQFTIRPEDPIILWDRIGTLKAALSNSKAYSIEMDWQWIEDRFWTWIHYVATKAGRGELFEAIRFLSYLQEKVLGPIAVELSGGKSNGVRHFEQVAGNYVVQMRSTLAPYSKKEIAKALFQMVELYRAFREDGAPETIKMNKKAEDVVVHYLEIILVRI